MTKRIANNLAAAVCLILIAGLAYIFFYTPSRMTAEDRFRMRHGGRVQSVFIAVVYLLESDTNATVASAIEAAKRERPSLVEELSEYAEVWVTSDRAPLMYSHARDPKLDPPTLLARTTDGVWLEGRMNARVRRLASPPDTSTGWVRFK